jgi:Putative auto-transporter adhesin, head GIN domain
MRKSVAVVVAASAAIAGCQAHAGGGATVSRNYQVGGFDQIEVAGPYDVEVRTGGNPGVTGHGSEKMLENTVVEVQGGKLLIRPQEHHGWFSWSSHGKTDFVVTVPQLRAATIAGSGDIKVDRVQGPQFEGAIGGSGDLSLAAVDVQSLKLSIGGSGDVKGGSGKAQSAEYNVAGAGDIDAGAVAAQQLKVSIAGSGDVHAHASGTADISIAGAGDVNVAGGAKCTVHKMGSGDVRCS